uniref:Uncharacterized protein n=1 Tax=Kalanchoe fedtschenkoi TaxID=63787 RepID=A0A7N0UUD3_KALFE
MLFAYCSHLGFGLPCTLQLQSFSLCVSSIPSVPFNFDPQIPNSYNDSMGDLLECWCTYWESRMDLR